MRSKVYVTRKFPGDGLQLLARHCDVLLNQGPRPPSRSELLKNVRGSDAIICMLSERIDARVMDAAGPGLRVISSYSTGFEHIDVEEATSRKIIVAYTGDVLAEATADLTFALLLACARRVAEGDRMVRQGKWKVGWAPDLLLGSAVHGATLGIIGLGRIGSAVAKRAKGFDMQVVYHNRSRDSAKELQLGVCYAELDELLSESDFVSVHVSLNESTDALIGMAQLKQMKRTAFLINTSRGQVVNERELARALKQGVIAGAGLDVFRSEPLAGSSPLVGQSNVVLLPHIGSATMQTRAKMGQVAVKNALDVLRGVQPAPSFVVNRSLLS